MPDNAQSPAGNGDLSIARGLEVLGQKGNPPMMRKVPPGSTDHAEFLRLAIPTDVPTTRLGALTEAAALKRSP